MAAVQNGFCHISTIVHTLMHTSPQVCMRHILCCSWDLSEHEKWISPSLNLESPKNVKFGCFATFCQFSKKKTIACFCIYCMYILGDDIDLLSRDRFDLIIAKVIFMVGKVRYGPFSHNYWLFSSNEVLPKFIASYIYYGMKPILS